MIDGVPEGLIPSFGDDDAEVIDFGPSRSEDERPELPLLPEQQTSGIDWDSIRAGIETAGLAANTAAGLYKTITIAVTGKDPFHGIPIDIPTGKAPRTSEESELARAKRLAK